MNTATTTCQSNGMPLIVTHPEFAAQAVARDTSLVTAGSGKFSGFTEAWIEEDFEAMTLIALRILVHLGEVEKAQKRAES